MDGAGGRDIPPRLLRIPPPDCGWPIAELTLMAEDGTEFTPYPTECGGYGDGFKPGRPICGIIGRYKEEGSNSLLGPGVADRGGGGRSELMLGVELRNLESSSRLSMSEYDSVLICEIGEGPGALPVTCTNIINNY